MSPAELIDAYLLTELVGVEPFWSSFVSKLPDEPDDAFALYDSRGRSDGRYLNEGDTLEHPGVQLRVRSLSYSRGYEKIKALASILDAVKRVAIYDGTTLFQLNSITRTTELLSLGADKSEHRRQFTTNYICAIGDTLKNPTATIRVETPVGVIDGVNAAFELTATPSLLLVFVNDVLQTEGDDYTYALNVLTFEAGSVPQEEDVLHVIYRVS